MSRWDALLWPPWFPVRARLPLIAQIAGGAALVAAMAMPRWSEVAQQPAVAHETTDPPASTVAQASTVPMKSSAPDVATVSTPLAVTEPTRPAHLNLDVRHSFQSVDLSISVDGSRVLDTTLAGSGKRFRVFGKRAERSFTKSLNLSPGVRVVRVRVRSAADKFDQTRVERFDLESAAVAALEIEADRSGLSVVADRPPPPKPPPAPAPAPAPQVTQVPQAVQVAQAVQAAQQAGALAELYQTLRSILIAVAGFIGSAATGFVVQEFLRARKLMVR